MAWEMDRLEGEVDKLGEVDRLEVENFIDLSPQKCAPK